MDKLTVSASWFVSLVIFSAHQSSLFYFTPSSAHQHNQDLIDSLFQLPATLALLYFPPLVITLTSLLIIALNFCSHLLDSPLINDPFLFSFISHHFCLSAHHCPQRSAHLLPGSLFLLLNLGVLASLYFLYYPVLTTMLIIKSLLICLTHCFCSLVH